MSDNNSTQVGRIVQYDPAKVQADEVERCYQQQMYEAGFERGQWGLFIAARLEGRLVQEELRSISAQDVVSVSVQGVVNKVASDLEGRLDPRQKPAGNAEAFTTDDRQRGAI